jgi:hypothetical protein
MHDFYVVKYSQKIWAIHVNFIKLPKVNKVPLGEILTNLVTLAHHPTPANGT